MAYLGAELAIPSYLDAVLCCTKSTCGLPRIGSGFLKKTNRVVHTLDLVFVEGLRTTPGTRH